MRVKEAMTRRVYVVTPITSLAEAASAMSELDVGILPVAGESQLLGVVTDRDVVVRGTGQARGPDAYVQEVMTPELRYCFEDESIAEVALRMGETQLRRCSWSIRKSGSLASSPLATLHVQSAVPLWDRRCRQFPGPVAHTGRSSECIVPDQRAI